MIVQSLDGPDGLAQFDGPSGKPIMHVVWRPDLYRALYDEATRRGIAIEHSHRFIDARESADGVVARFSDDSTACADILIGADGSRSTVRSMIDPTAPPPLYTGLLGLGGLTTRAGVDPTNAEVPIGSAFLRNRVCQLFGRQFSGSALSSPADQARATLEHWMLGPGDFGGRVPWLHCCSALRIVDVFAPMASAIIFLVVLAPCARGTCRCRTSLRCPRSLPC